MPPSWLGWRLRRAGACRAVRGDVASAAGPRAARAGGRVGGGGDAKNAAASGRGILALGERVVLGPCSFGQLSSRGELGREGRRQDEASRRNQSGCRVWSHNHWDWRGDGGAAAVGGVEQPEARGNWRSSRLNKPGGGLRSSSGDDRQVTASLAEAASCASRRGSRTIAGADAEAKFHPRSRAE